MPPLRIFISYGRDQFAPLAARLAADLPGQLDCEAWYDQQLQTGEKWARFIQRKLRWVAENPANGRFIYLLTLHSTRDDSFCLQEMQHALDHKVPILPLLVETCEKPIEIYGTQHLDFRPVLPVDQHETAYHKLLVRLVNDLSREPRIIETSPPLEGKVGRGSEPAAGATRVREKDGMLMVYVPAGEFLMGSTDADKDAQPWEKPQHTVYLDDFWIDQTPVTNAMFARFLGERGNQNQEGIDWYAPGQGRIKRVDQLWRVESGFEQHPVVAVNWHGARAYAQWVEAELPTEAQWEKAARGTDGRRYPWGNPEPDATLANFFFSVGTTTPVGSYLAGASPYGALDMAGNVWEWCADWYNKTYYQVSPPKNPPGPLGGEYRVLRGGSWYFDLKGARCVSRNRRNPVSRLKGNGFRLSLRKTTWRKE